MQTGSFSCPSRSMLGRIPYSSREPGLPLPQLPVPEAVELGLLIIED